MAPPGGPRAAPAALDQPGHRPRGLRLDRPRPGLRPRRAQPPKDPPPDDGLRDDKPEAKIADKTYGGLRSLDGRHRGWRVFFTAPAMDVPVTVTLGDHKAHGRSDRSGHVDLTFRGHGLGAGWHTATVEAQNSSPVEVPIFVVGDDVTFGLVSDIDDTVISTMLPRAFLAAYNTFVKHEGNRRVVPGMRRSTGRCSPTTPARRRSTSRPARGTPRRR